MSSTILKNAIDSIQVGVKDYKSNDDRRIVSAVRNVVAGLLLLFKEELRRSSPYGEILLKSQIVPSIDEGKGLILHAKGRKTVTVEEILERFRHLNIEVDEKKLRKIANERNNIEHYCPTLNSDSIRELLVDAFVIIDKFIRDVLNKTTVELLGEETTSIFLEEKRIYNESRNRCEESIQALDFDQQDKIEIVNELRCVKCNSKLLMAFEDKDKICVNNDEAITLTCQSCGESFNLQNDIERLISYVYDSKNHYSVKDGGDSITQTCPECYKETCFVGSDGSHFCMACDFSCELTECESCGETLSLEEKYSGDDRCFSCESKWQKMIQE